MYKIQKIQKKGILFEIDIFTTNNVFTVTFDQNNASLLNKSIHSFKKILLLPNF